MIERAHRIDKEEKRDPLWKGPIIAKCLNHKNKGKVLLEYRPGRLWKDRLYVNKDFRVETMLIRRELLKQAKEPRKKREICERNK